MSINYKVRLGYINLSCYAGPISSTINHVKDENKSVSLYTIPHHWH